MKKIILMILVLVCLCGGVNAGGQTEVRNWITGTDGKGYPMTGDTTTGLLVNVGDSVSINIGSITNDTAGLLGVTDFNTKVDTKTSELYNIIESSSTNSIDSLTLIYNKLNTKFDTSTNELYNIIESFSVSNNDSLVLIYNELELINAELNYANDTVTYDSISFVYGISADGSDSVIYSTITTKVEKLKSEVANAVFDYYGLTDGITDSRKGKLKSITY